eukprot:15349453-Alexandrium_andersonii.AAC.1
MGGDKDPPLEVLRGGVAVVLHRPTILDFRLRPSEELFNGGRPPAHLHGTHKLAQTSTQTNSQACRTNRCA